MPSFNRRGFLQMIGAAGVTPLLPALPVRSVAATAGASSSKALWAGIYAKSGSAAKFGTVARNMGLSSSAVQGVTARSVGVRVALAAAANSMPRVAASGSGAAQSEPLRSARRFLHDIERFASDDSVAARAPDTQVDVLSEPVSPETDAS